MDLIELAQQYGTIASALTPPPPQGEGPVAAEHRRVFGHVCNSDCPPCETQWGRDATFQQAHRLADVAGFYRAWGLRPAEHGERADHIAAEVEFEGFLAWKEAEALRRGEPENAAIAREARERFFREHLGRFGTAFARRLEQVAGEGPLVETARALLGTLAHEARDLGLDRPEATLEPRPPEDPAEGSCFECGAAAGSASPLEGRPG